MRAGPILAFLRSVFFSKMKDHRLEFFLIFFILGIYILINILIVKPEKFDECHTPENEPKTKKSKQS